MSHAFSVGDIIWSRKEKMLGQIQALGEMGVNEKWMPAYKVEFETRKIGIVLADDAVLVMRGEDLRVNQPPVQPDKNPRDETVELILDNALRDLSIFMDASEPYLFDDDLIHERTDVDVLSFLDDLDA